MAQFYNNAIEHEIEIALQELYKANLAAKAVVSDHLDRYIYTGKLTDAQKFKAEVRALFSFNDYGGKAVRKQEAVNIRDLATVFKEQGVAPIYDYVAKYKNIEQFKKDYAVQIEKIVTAAWAMLLKQCKEFDTRMQRALNESRTNN